MRYCLAGIAIVGVVGFFVTLRMQTNPAPRIGRPAQERVVKSNEEWKKILTPEQYHVTREKGTECAFTGDFRDNHEDGFFACVCCGQPLFDSKAKFESGSGWPSFWQPVNEENVSLSEDYGLLTPRTEITCSRCDAHLGHVFNDGPRPTGLRYCLNSAALKFVKREK